MNAQSINTLERPIMGQAVRRTGGMDNSRQLGVLFLPDLTSRPHVIPIKSGLVVSRFTRSFLPLCAVVLSTGSELLAGLSLKSGLFLFPLNVANDKAGNVKK